MDLDDQETRELWHAHLAGLFSGRKVIAGVVPLAALTDLVSILARCGAEKPLLVHAELGAGPVPSEEEAGRVEVRLPAYKTMTEEVREHDRVLRSLPSSVRDAIDRYDPDRQALWCVAPFASPAPIEGRAVVGARPSSWSALEDKIAVDDIWDEVGFPRSERRVVELSSPTDLHAACRDLDVGSGVVWVGDARDGLNGGGEFTRWVVTAEERAEALDFFEPRCDRVRVMPFLDGVPCSIHGIVLPSGTAAFRPVELAILRGGGRRFVYGGQGTTWDPPHEDREQMRELVRRTGSLLGERIGYRGGFGIDGVLTAHGFRPTELNPRFSPA
ncbi:MAG TPA: hypothetical protein VF165_06210 [Nocardioidaceae bacterium]